MPPLATALYGRWWQLETWLRSLIYVELKAAFGPAWATQLPAQSEKRQDADEGFRYMATADAQTQLAYADVVRLLAIIERHWELFEVSLLPKGIWLGRTEELRHLRNRIGHCRRPHVDDLARLEQTLRDLESGAFRALSAFNHRGYGLSHLSDPVVDAWIRRKHDAAECLLEHAERQYEVFFQLSCSRRPWCHQTPSEQAISGTKGHLWHARWFWKSHRELGLARFWNATWARTHSNPLLFICSTGPSDLEASFSALESPTVVADAIGTCFDAILMHSRPVRVSDPLSYSQWTSRSADLDPRVQAGGMWAVVDASTVPISLFGS